MPSLLISSPRKIIEDKNRGLKELTLGWLKLETMFIKPTETKIHSVQVFRESYGQDEPIVDEHQTFTKVKITHVFLHRALITAWSIFRSKNRDGSIRKERGFHS